MWTGTAAPADGDDDDDDDDNLPEDLFIMFFFRKWFFAYGLIGTVHQVCAILNGISMCTNSSYSISKLYLESWIETLSYDFMKREMTK